MKDWFESLQQREQVFVSVGAVIGAFVILYAGIWGPLDRKHDAMRDKVSSWERSLAELRPLQSMPAAPSGNSSPTAGNQRSPIIIVDETLNSRGLARYRQRSQPTSSNGIRVEFEDVAFDDLVLWLGDLGEQYNMHVQAGSFSPGSQQISGRVNATLTLERSL